MEINEAKKCKDCNGIGSLSTDYLNADHNWERGTGDDVTCENCKGTGQEPDEEIVVERIVGNLTPEQEEKLQNAHTEQMDKKLMKMITQTIRKYKENKEKEGYIPTLEMLIEDLEK